MKVYLDANILFSGANPDSPLRLLFEDLSRRGESVSSGFALEEARRNLEIKRPQWGAHLDSMIMELGLSEISDQPFSSSAFENLELEDKDRPILAAAIKARCTHLLTGDRKHFRHPFGREIEGVAIVSPVMLAEELGDGG